MTNSFKTLSQSHRTARRTPQTQPIPGMESRMVENAAGGYVFEADSWAQFKRFLILGTTGGSYYIAERTLTKDNLGVVKACLEENPIRFIDAIIDVSTNNRALNQDPVLYALALAASYRADMAYPCQVKMSAPTLETKAKRAEYDEAARVRKYALANLHRVARTGTALYHWAQYVQAERGWGRSLRRAVADWYTKKPVDKLAYQAIKYKSRDGWSHRDLFRLAHPKDDPVRAQLFTYISRPEQSLLTKGLDQVVHAFDGIVGTVPQPLLQVAAAEELLHIEGSDDRAVRKAAQLIREYDLPRETVPTQLQKSADVWEALLEKMPLTAMLRTLNRMTASGLLTDRSDAMLRVLDALGDQAMLQNARVHPMQVLIALKQYSAGRGDKGSLMWKPVQRVVEALNDAFYDTFKFVTPTRKDMLVAVDVSGSMTTPCSGISNMSASEAATAMALVIVSTEPKSELIAFDTSTHNVGIRPNMRLDEAIGVVARMSHGGTDLSQPFRYAGRMLRTNRYDAILSFTDNESWAGNGHALELLIDLRRRHGDVLAVNCATAANRSTVLDPKYKGVLEIAGMDAALPGLVNEFVQGNL